MSTTTPVVTIYTTGPGCMACRMTKKELSKRGIKYAEVDLRTSTRAQVYVTETLGFSEAPVCIADTATVHSEWSGFRLDKINSIAP